MNILQGCKYFMHPTGCKSIHCVILRLAYEANEVVLNSLVDAYTNCYHIEHAQEFFTTMKRLDIVSRNTIDWENFEALNALFSLGVSGS